MQPGLKEQYQIAIPNDKAATYRVVTLILAGINAAAFAWLYFTEPNPSNRNFALLGTLLGFTALGFYIAKIYANRVQSFRIEVAFFLLALIWFMTGNGWLGLPLIIFGAFGWIVNQPTVILFDASGIRYPSFPVKHFEWKEVDFVILKDGILTIELKNNRNLQFTLAKTVADEIP
ncbi:MAG: hypothetical protein EOO03_16485, partial [Chitinophagaceae bacterium]